MSRSVRIVTALVIALGVLIVGPSAVSAHADFESSQPADGSTVDGPLEEVILEFSGTPTAIDDGIVVADASGVQYVPVEIVQDDLLITARFDPALGDGSYTLAWQVRSDDTHTISGSFSFVVAAPIPTTTAVVPATSAALPTTTVPILAVAPTAAPPAAPELVDTSEASNVTRIGRLIFFPSAVLAIGVLAFAAFAFAGRREELGTLIRVVRWLGVGVAMGALIEVVGLETLFGGFDVLLDESAGRAALARLLGGLMLVVGFASIRSAGRSASSPRSLSAAVAVDQLGPQSQNVDAETGPWRPSAADSIGLIGMFLVLVSFAFDGHTLSEGPRLLHSVLSIVHVAAAGVWAGGVFALAIVLHRRHNDRVDSRALEMVLKFSVVAMVSLVLAGLAGVVMALFIDSDVTSYLSTDWGRVLVAKVILVGAAALLGAFNHFRVLPALENAPADPDAIAQARNTVTAEAFVLVVVALVSAILVGASTL